MKKILLCLTVLFLSSCIPVEDFGIYWDKGIIDPALLGKWKGEANNGYHMINKGGTYQIDSLDKEDRKEKDYSPIAARTLKVGSYTFLMTFIKEGDEKETVLIRYKKKGDIIQQYSLKSRKMDTFLEKNYSKAKNIKKFKCKGRCWYNPGVRIEKFDNEVYKILSEIPDTKKFWILDERYLRQADLNK